MRIRGGLLVLVLATGCIRSVDNIEAEEGGFITGTVVARSASTGLLEPVVGARVDLIGGSVGETTKTEGRFTLRRLPLGRHGLDLLLRASGGAPAQARRVAGLRLFAEGQSLDLGDVQLGALADVVGEVRLADVDSEVAAVGSAVVLVATPFATIVGLDGAYRMPAVPAGQYQVAVVRDGYVPGTIDGAEVPAGLAAPMRQIVLEPLDEDAVYEVRGAYDVTEGEPNDADVVFISETTTATPAQVRAQTDGEGGFSAELRPGVYRVRFEKPGFRTAQLRNVVVTPTSVLGLDIVVLAPEDAADYDGDGTPDAEDDDDDDDGCPDDVDQFDTDRFGCLDEDGDGVPDELQPDDDDDGLLDVEELTAGADGWITDPNRADSDDDGVIDPLDRCPLHPLDDCDMIIVQPTDTPTIAGFMPRQGTVQSTITFTGMFLQGALGASFGNAGAFAPAYDVGATAFRVDVPGLASDGPVTVSFRNAANQVVGTFVRSSEPFVQTVVPGQVHLGGTLLLNGSALQSLQGVWVGGVAAEILPNGTDAEVSIVVPTTVVPGAVVVEYTGGSVRRAVPGTVRVFGDPTVLEVSPATVPEGATVSAFGRGFAGTGQGMLTATVDGAPVTIVSSTDRVVGFVVPNAPQPTPRTAELVVALDGRASQPVSFTVDEDAVAITDIGPAILFEGGTLTITGRNLHAPPTYQVTEVRVGGQPATIVTSAANALEVTVPSGAQSSTLEIDYDFAGPPARSGTVTYARGPTILRIVGTSGTTGSENPCAVLANGDLLSGASTLSMRRWDPDMAGFTMTTGAFGVACSRVALAPDRTHAVVVNALNTVVYAVTLPDFAPSPGCAIADFGGNAFSFRRHDVAFTRTSTAALAFVPLPAVGAGTGGVLRVPLDGGPCSVVGPTLTGSVRALRMIPGTNDRELMVQGTRSGGYVLGRMDVSTGTWIEEPDTVMRAGGNYQLPFLNLDPLSSAAWSGHFLHAPGGERPLAILVDNVSAAQYSSTAMSPDYRYVFGPEAFDFATRRTSTIEETDTEGSIAYTSPTGALRWFHKGPNSNADLRVAEVVVSPPSLP
ncbi:MAG: carboxypeptidase regulatory-like domain-containing protein [Deltaproteobacteria bacterium]